MAELGAQLGEGGLGSAEAMRWTAVGLLAFTAAAVVVLPALAAVYEAHAPPGGVGGGGRGAAPSAAARASVVLQGGEARTGRLASRPQASLAPLRL